MTAGRNPWWLPGAVLLGTWVVRLFGATWRFEVESDPRYAEARAGGERFVYALWHSGLLPLAVSRRGEGIAVLVSRHRDGELVARLIEALGYVTARGSSTRGGDAGVRELLSWAERGRDLAVTPDGPRGPAECLKDGILYLAARTGRRIVPIGLGTSPAWVLRSWDRFRVPRPFARVRVSYGAPMRLAPEGDLGSVRGELEAALAAVTAEARQRAGEVS